MSGDSLNLVEILQIEPFSKTACSQIPNRPEGFGFGFGGSLDDKALVCRENECYTMSHLSMEWAVLDNVPSSLSGVRDPAVVRLSGDRLWIVGGWKNGEATDQTWIFTAEGGIEEDVRIGKPVGGHCIFDTMTDEFAIVAGGSDDFFIYNYENKTLRNVVSILQL